MNNDAYQLIRPRTSDTCVVFAAPHSGRWYSPDFLAASILSEVEIRSSEDAFVDQLFADAPDFGSPILSANVPRAYVDLNRNKTELDPALINGLHRMPPNPRVASGLGVVPRVVANGRAIYSGKISLAEAQKRIDQVWHPYHGALQSLLDANMARFGQAILIDCHSMPHEAVVRSGPAGVAKPQVVIGDLFGASASGRIVDGIESAFAAAGFCVARNMPFAGAYIARHYGRPSRRQHVIQVELDRRLYMDEATLIKHEGFDELRRTLRGVIAEIVKIGRAPSDRIAAE